MPRSRKDFCLAPDPPHPAATIVPLSNAPTLADRPARLAPYLALHIAGAALVHATSFSVQAILAVVAIKQFHANEWQSLLITATPTIFYSLSIFWNDFFKRLPFGRYLAAYWLIAGFPLALMGFADNYWMLLIPHLISCVGGAGYPPITGELLQSLYPAAKRGRIYSVLWGTSLVAAALYSVVLGKWLTRDPESYRFFLPIVAGMQLAGVGCLELLSRLSGHGRSRVLDVRGHEKGHFAKLVDPVAHMGRILKADPTFARYEAAYMTYGIGWMIASALLPLLAAKKLNLEYDAIAQSTQASYLLALVAVLFPAGLLMDRFGAVRTTAGSFALLGFYPLALIFVRDESTLTAASVFFGIAHAGASVGWTVGPISLAPTPAHVPQYMAIHATMVGIRGKLFQGLGILLFWLSGDFWIPLLVAGLAYYWAGAQMWQLHRRMIAAPKITAPAVNGQSANPPAPPKTSWNPAKEFSAEEKKQKSNIRG